MKKTPPKSLSFAEFTPEVRAVNTLRREDFSKVPPAVAARRLTDFHASRVKLEEVTQTQKDVVLTRVLENLAEKQHDLSTITPDVMAQYREWLRALTEKEIISVSYAGHIVGQWNATIRLAFGENGKPGESLLMRGFPKRARRAPRLTEEEFNAIVGAANRRRYRTLDDKEAFLAYLEIEWSSGGRIGSFSPVRRKRRRDPPAPQEIAGAMDEVPEPQLKTATVGDIDWTHGTLRLRHMKNVDEHTAILTERALTHLRSRVEFLRTRPYWHGDETPLLAGRTGQPLTCAAVNRMLKDCLAMAGIQKHLTTHSLRKNVGTHIARTNPRYAAEQLGITPKVFDAHYNQPVVEDRLTAREILPGAVVAQPRTPDEMVGQAWLRYSSGKLSRADFEAIVVQADRLRAQPSSRVPETSAYG